MKIQNNMCNHTRTNFDTQTPPGQINNRQKTNGMTGEMDPFAIRDGSDSASNPDSDFNSELTMSNEGKSIDEIFASLLEPLKKWFANSSDQPSNSDSLDSGEIDGGDIGGGSIGKSGATGTKTMPLDNPKNTKGANAVQSVDNGKSSNPALLEAINNARIERGLKPLVEDPALSQVSRENDAANHKNGLGHHVFRAPSMGQITAMNGGGETAKGAVEQWINSPGHAAILFDPNHTKVGVSISGDFATADFS